MPATVFGLRPSLPFFLKGNPWFDGTIPAERLAAFRIGVGLMLIVEVLWNWLPYCGELFGPNSLSPRELIPNRFQGHHLNWSLLHVLPPMALMVAWLFSGVCLVLGFKPNLMAAVAWAISVSVFKINPHLSNSGDLLRTFALLITALAPTRWAWSAFPATSLRGVHVAAWPIAIIVVQLTCVYFVSGIHKAMSQAWRDGTVMVNVFAERNWSLTPGLAPHIPMTIVKLSTWTTLAWEVLFPALLIHWRLRWLAFGLGFLFHLGTAFTLEVGLFPWWAIALYLPLFPWEKWRYRVKADVMATESASS